MATTKRRKKGSISGDEVLSRMLGFLKSGAIGRRHSVEEERTWKDRLLAARKALFVIMELPYWVDDSTVQKPIPIGSSFQADVPVWTGRPNKDGSDDNEANDYIRMGTRREPVEDDNGSN